MVLNLKEKVYKSRSMRSVAIHNLFNRTCIFESIQDKEINNSRDFIFKDSIYQVYFSGKYLNHSTDFPLFGLIISQWRNNLSDGIDSSNFVTISLLDVSNLIKIAGNANRESEFKKIKASLARLNSQKIKFRYNKKVKADFIEGRFFENEPKFDFKNKIITMTLTPFLSELYLTNSDITYINFEKLKTMKKEPYMAFFKYLSTHAPGHIDFKLEKLSRILGLLRRGMDESRCREYIVDKLKALVKLKFIWCYKWNPKTKVYRIIQCKHFKKAEAEFVMKNLHSNLDNWKKR